MIRIPKIRKNSIMDKCVIDDFASDVNNAFVDINNKLDNCIDNIENVNGLINSAILTCTNSSINSASSTLSYDEKFIDARNINMASTCEIDFENNACKCYSTSRNVYNFDSIYVDNNLCDHLRTPNSSTLSCSSEDKVVISCSFNSVTDINNICINMTLNNSCTFNVYNSNNDEDVLISTGSSPYNVRCTFDKISTNKIKIELIFNDVTNINISYITGYLNIDSDYSELITKEIKLYNNTGNLKVNVSSNTNDYKTYIGFINKDNDVIWNSGDEAIKFNTTSYSEKISQHGYPQFGTSVESYKRIFSISNKTNYNSIDVLSGFGSWKYTLINGAFINNDMTVIEFTPNDIVEEKFIDCESYEYNLTAGDLIVLDQTFESNEGAIVTLPAIKSIPDDSEDYTSHFRYKVTVNGDRVSNLSQDEDMDIEIRKGINKIQIIMNLKKEVPESSYKVKANNYINFKNYSNRIYYKKMIKSSKATLINDKNRDCYSIIGNDIVVASLLQSDRFFISYEDYIDSDIHYFDYIGQYMKVIIKVCIYNRLGNSTIIDRVWI